MVHIIHPRRVVSLGIRRAISVVLLGLALLAVGGSFGLVHIGVPVAYAQDWGDPLPTLGQRPPTFSIAPQPSTSASPATTPAATDSSGDGTDKDSDDDGNFLTRMVGNAAGSALGKLTDSVMASTVTMATWSMSFWMNYTYESFYGEGPDGIRDTTKGVINIVWQITAVVFVISLIVSGLKLAASRRIGVDDGLEQIGVNIFRYLAYMVFVPAAVPLGLIAADEIAAAIMNNYANCGRTLTENPEGLGAAQQCVVLASTMDSADDALKAPAVMFLSLIVALVSVFGSAAQFVALVVRTFMVPIAAGLMPLFAAGAFSEMGKNGLNKLIGYVVAGVIFKPVAALLYVVVIWVTTASPGGTTMDMVVSLCMMAMVGFTAPSLVKLIAPTEAAGGSSGSGMMAAAGAAMGGAGGAASGKSSAGGSGNGSSSRPVGADPQQTAQTTAHFAQAAARASAGDYAGAAQYAMQGMGSMGKSSQSSGGSGTPGAGPTDGPDGPDGNSQTSSPSPTGSARHSSTSPTGAHSSGTPSSKGLPAGSAGAPGDSGDAGSAPESGAHTNETRAMVAQAGQKMAAAGEAMKGAWKTARHPVQSAKRAGAMTAAAAKDPVKAARLAYGHAKQAYNSRPAQFARSVTVAGFRGVSAAVKTGLDETDKAISGYSAPVSHTGYSGRIGR